MLFSSIPFLYYFLPVVLVLYFAVPFKAKNLVLLATSLFFYFWGEPVYVFVLLASTLIGWAFGFPIDRYRGRKASKVALIGSIVVGIGLLAVFKYSDFFISIVNGIIAPSAGPAEAPIRLLGLALPIGISFYTFQNLSYSIDLYRGNAKLQRSLINFATYVALFPQLVAGPIVRYTTVANELGGRKHSFEDFALGASRFVIGLGKKVLISNLLGELCEIYKRSGDSSVLYTWLYVLAFALHIYFDFSGYSDMAIGLGRVFGFRFLENFNYPYIASSITDFWRRWHISLSSWFRDYIYIPLGGNRVSKSRHILNILVVWFLTGFWHGAGWNFIAWGMFFGILLIAEKNFLLKAYDRLPKAIPRIIMGLAVMLSWVLFDAASITEALNRIGLMFGFGASSLVSEQSLYYARSYLVPLIVAVIGSTPFPKRMVERLSGKGKGELALTFLQPLTVAVLIISVTAYLIDGSFNPFIYFRF
ncbi:MAG: MBOAT family protein [Oscillospiraceae bacterium]|nr:MBOAT family protein [Oscillospiraceae bacterium]